MLPQEMHKKFAVITLYVGVFLVAAWLISTYLKSAIMPFAVAYIIAECFRPVVRYSEKHVSFPRRFFVLFVVIIGTVSLFALAFALCRQVFLELSELMEEGKELLTRIREDDAYASEIIEKINSLLPFVDIRERLWSMRANLDEEIWNLLVSLGEKMSGDVLPMIGGAVAAFPKILFVTAVTVIATYYFAVDRVKINSAVLSLFPKKLRGTLKRAKDTVFDTVSQYIRAYGLIFLVTFAELLVAFLILGVDYALLLSLIIAIIDFLPVLGTGTVLLPWGIAMLAFGRVGPGIGLLITYAVITVVRQVIEPRVVGKFIGLSPIASLVSMYVGLELLGIVGLFLFPVTAIVLKEFLKEKQRE